MRTTIITLSLPFCLAIASCTGGGGSSSSSTPMASWSNFSEQEPNDELGEEENLGTVSEGTRVRIHGSTDPNDMDLFQFDSSSYLRASFVLKPEKPDCDVDLFVYDDIYGIVTEEFEAIPPPVAESGSFEFLPGEFLIIGVHSYHVPAEYTLELQFTALPGHSLTSGERPNRLDASPSTSKGALNDQKILAALGLEMPEEEVRFQIIGMEANSDGPVVYLQREAPLEPDPSR